MLNRNSSLDGTFEERIEVARLAEDAKWLNDRVGESRFRRLATHAEAQQAIVEQSLDMHRAGAD